MNTLAKWSAVANNTSNVVSRLIFDPVIDTDEQGQPVPSLATAWEFSADYMAVTLTLRDDVYFTDGTQMTADDLIFTFEKMRDDTEHFPDSVVKNWRLYLGELAKVDDYKFTINFTQPMPEWWYQITQPNLQVISKAAYEKMGYDAYYANPVGTGPYVVSKWDPANSAIELTLRSDEHGWWSYRANNTFTNVKTITVKYSPEAQTRLASLRSGEVQFIDTIAAPDKEILDSEGFVTSVAPPVNAVFLQTASAPGDILENQKLREALSLSIDRQGIVDALLYGFAIPIKWPALPGVLGYTTDSAHFYAYDLEKAKQLVQESGYKGEPIDFIYTSTTVNIGNELTQAIQSMAAEAGINLVIRPLESAVYNDARTNHDYDLCLAAIAISGNAWLKIGKDVVGDDRFNTGYQNQELKDLGKSLATIIDQDEASAVYQKLWEIELAEFSPNVYLYWPTIINAWDASVTGISFHNTQYPDLTRLFITD